MIKTNFSLLSDHDIYLFKEGSHCRLYEKMGAHSLKNYGIDAIHFAVWAPNAKRVSVIGDFNEWRTGDHPLQAREDDSGIWEGSIEGVAHGSQYKYHIESRFNKYRVDKGDPMAFFWEERPKTASVVFDLEYAWNDSEWMKNRYRANALDAPMSIYEVHIGSWQRVSEEGCRSLTYKELAVRLVKYVMEMGFTHVEFMPAMEHPFYGSWGYQKVGYFAPSSAYGQPQDFMYLIDCLHQAGIGVILDWVPSHFPNDEHGLTYFDGTYLYEHADHKQGFHPEWNTYIFNYGRNEVRAFLASSAFFWLDKYHADGIRVDAVSSMLYLDYARMEDKWIPNKFGGRENLEAVQFIRSLNESVYRDFPDTQMIAEESTAWPMVSRPNNVGGLGFGMKWNMGWMHDILNYFSLDPVYRKYHHNQLTFSIWYAFSENFVLPFSHDEVVYGKGSLLKRMPGTEWEKFANLRLLFGFMYTHPGKKILFMGGEFGQWNEWNHEGSLDWHLLEYKVHQGLHQWFRDLNRKYREETALFQLDFTQEGFEWIDCSDWEQSVLIFLRKGKKETDLILVACNFTPIPRFNYRMGAPRPGMWREILNSDAVEYGGQGYGNWGGMESAPIPAHDKFNSLLLTLPPLGIVIFKYQEDLNSQKM